MYLRTECDSRLPVTTHEINYSLLSRFPLLPQIPRRSLLYLPIKRRLHIVLQTLFTIPLSVIFIWIPGHIGHPQHERVHRAVKEATRFPKVPTIPSPSHYTILKPLPSPNLGLLWLDLWKNHNHNKLRLIKHKPSSWSSANINSCHEDIILSRLRIGSH